MSEAGNFVPIRDLIDGCWPGEWGTDPVSDTGNCVVFRATDIDNDGRLYQEGGAARQVLKAKLKAKSLKVGDILLEASGGAPDKPVGRVALVAEQLHQPSLTSNFFRFIRPAKNIDARFLLLQLVALNRSSSIWRYQQQTTGLINLKVEHYLNHKIWMPSTAQQKKIADVIFSLSAAIEKTEALINKYQQIKAGLMHDLFTRGALPNGKLRPRRSEAPELYRETTIGFIPKEWQLKPCTELCTRICVGIVIQPTQYYVDEGIPAFRSANVRENGINPNNFVYISSKSNRLLKKSQAKSGDILSVRTGYPGTSAVVPPEFAGSNCVDILISSPNISVTSEYLCAWINSNFGKEQVLRQQGGMAQQHFNVAEMRELLVALPEIEEQKRIQDRTERISTKIIGEQALLEKLRSQKLGLMQDLLTGKVPVKTDEPEATHA